MPDASRPAATSSDTQYSLSVEDAAALYARAGHPRTLRTVQRYCAFGHLDCVKAQTMLGDKYFVEASSVARHIAQIEELVALDRRTQSPGLSRLDASPVAGLFSGVENQQDLTTDPDQSRPVDESRPFTPAETAGNHSATEEDRARQTPTPAASLSRQVAADDPMTSRYVAQLEKDVERLNEDREFLRTQITTKDQQIGALLERDRETNILVRGLQQMLSPLLGPVRRDPPEQGNQPTF